MIDVDKIAGALKIDTDKIYEALPAIATILEKSELVDYAQTLGQLSNAAGFKIMIRIVARMKEYEKEVEDVLNILFDVDASTMSSKKKMELLRKILVEKELMDFI